MAQGSRTAAAGPIRARQSRARAGSESHVSCVGGAALVTAFAAVLRPDSTAVKSPAIRPLSPQTCTKPLCAGSLRLVGGAGSAVAGWRRLVNRASSCRDVPPASFRLCRGPRPLGSAVGLAGGQLARADVERRVTARPLGWRVAGATAAKRPGLSGSADAGSIGLPPPVVLGVAPRRSHPACWARAS